MENKNKISKEESEAGNSGSEISIKNIREKYRFPKVFKGNNGDKTTLEIIYKNRVESYELVRKYTKADIDKENPDCSYDYEKIYGKGWNAYHELDMHKEDYFWKEVKIGKEGVQ